MNTVHNRPIPSYITTPTMRASHLKRREIQLAVFSIFGAPFIISILQQSAIPLKDMATIELIGGNNSSVTNTTIQDKNKGILFLLVNKITNLIPS